LFLFISALFFQIFFLFSLFLFSLLLFSLLICLLLYQVDESAMKCKEEVDACRRQVRMNSEVHVVYDDGDTTTETLADDKFTAGAKKVVKPVGRKVDVEDAANASAAIECNQQ